MSLYNNPLIRKEVLEYREFQDNIARESIKRNTLIVLPTALGKTIIAALVSAYFLYNFYDKKILFMAPTKPLVNQHRDVFLKVLKIIPEDTQIITGKMNPDYRLHLWNKSEAKIFFATPETVRNDLDAGLNLKDFSLLIFDECHRAVKDYAYTKVAKKYVSQCPWPIIIGLTASPGANKQRIKEVCDALFIEQIIVRTEEDEDVKKYINPIKMEIKIVKQPESYINIRNIIKESLNEKLRELHSLGVIKKDPKYIYRKDLLEIGEELRIRIEESMLDEERGPLYKILATQSIALILYHALELLDSQGIHALLHFMEKITQGEKRIHKILMKDPSFHKVFQIIKEGFLEEHPKIYLLKRIVENELTLNQNGRILVFTQYRDTASFLSSILKESGFKAEKFIGHGQRDKEIEMTQEEQIEILEKFRNGEIKILVSTSIGEEGLDIPQVDLVIFYEPVPSEIRYIQRRGRTGRARIGKVVILATENTLDMAYLRSSKRKVEKMIAIIKNLNMELKPFKRIEQFKPCIIPMEKIIEAEKLIKLEAPSRKEEAKPILVQSMLDIIDEYDEILEKSFYKEVNAVSKYILKKVLEAGESGINIKSLIEEGEYEGLSPGIINASIKKLEKANQICLKGEKIMPYGYAFMENILSGKTNYEANTHEIEIEKILPGKAIVIVDDKWHAILESSEYYGPRQLVKKGNRFKAAAKLYHLDGKLYIRVYGVTTQLD